MAEFISQLAFKKFKTKRLALRHEVWYLEDTRGRTDHADSLIVTENALSVILNFHKSFKTILEYYNLVCTEVILYNFYNIRFLPYILRLLSRNGKQSFMTKFLNDTLVDCKIVKKAARILKKGSIEEKMISSYCRIMSWWAEKGGVRCNSEVVFGALASTPKLARKRKRLGARKRGCERRANTINSSDTTSVKNYQTWIITHCTFFENPPKNSKIEKKITDFNCSRISLIKAIRQNGFQ